jgi:hypothetical protein
MKRDREIQEKRSANQSLDKKSRHERACLHRALPDRLQHRPTFVLPRPERLEELDDLVPFPLSNVVDADHAHLDVIVEQKVKQAEEPFERVIVHPAWERAVRRYVTPNALDRLGDPEELESTADGAARVYLEWAR